MSSRHDLPVFIWISSFPNFISLEPIIKAYVRKQQLASVAICLASVCCFIFLWISVFGFIGRLSCFNWSRIQSAGAFAKAAVVIVTAYATLLAVDARYISLAIILIILLAFMGALFVIVSLKGRLKRDEDDNKAGNKSTGDVVSAASRSDMDSRLLLTAVLPCWVLSFMRHFNGDDLAIYYFLLFLSSSLGELSLLMARLPFDVAPAFVVIHRASLVVVLITAHTMAVELLGDTAVLVCAPEIFTALVWLIIQLGHGGYATIQTLEAALRKADIAVLGVVALLTYREPIRDESDLLSSYMSALVACSFSVILPSLCVFSLCQWRGQTGAASSSELEGAIRLLCFCRDILLKGAAMFLVVKPLLDVRLRLQLQGLMADRWNGVVLKLFGAGT
ncbi:unnamed protein product [Urochloa decumbens]|uniref:Dolichol kinase n=1 Tax=Urochloa decumbens TaxID=240449 RepID=A0ABC9AHY1_9POAL